jgi:pimeloyl-ACP methyl ester carboxylesterase
LVGGGFTVLALDVRGHGESTKKGGETLNYLSFGKQEWLAAVEDLKAARDYLVSKEGVEPRRIGIVGASIGCSLALEYARQELNLPVLVLLSPGTEYHDIDSLASARAYGSRAIMIIACAQDTKDDGNNQQAVAAKDLYDALGENAAKKTNIFNEGNFHGTDMLGKTLDGKNVNGEIMAELNLLKQN